MKKQICCIIAAVTVVTMLPGCGEKIHLPIIRLHRQL